jgi:hypothetical protein
MFHTEHPFILCTIKYRDRTIKDMAMILYYSEESFTVIILRFFKVRHF